VNCNLAMVLNPQQLSVAQVSGAEVKHKIIPLDSIKTLDLDVLFFMEADLTNELMAALESEKNFYPMLIAEKFALDKTKFPALQASNLSQLWRTSTNSWCLQQNLNLMESLFENIDHLVGLWPNNRSDFFEELWYKFKTCLASSELTFIYNDLSLPEKEHEKESLIKISLGGHKSPKGSKAGQLQDKILAHYENDFGPSFHLVEFIPERGEFAATMTLSSSPILVMGKIPSLSKFQTATLKALCEGINRSIPVVKTKHNTHRAAATTTH
jgi:hypothetical protein